MKVRVDSATCAGHGRCWTTAPKIFSADDDGFAEPQDEAIGVPDGLEDLAERGARSCPEAAIAIEK